MLRADWQQQTVAAPYTASTVFEVMVSNADDTVQWRVDGTLVKSAPFDTTLYPLHVYGTVYQVRIGPPSSIPHIMDVALRATSLAPPAMPVPRTPTVGKAPSASGANRFTLQHTVHHGHCAVCPPIKPTKHASPTIRPNHVQGI